MNYDLILEELGEFGTWQKLIAVLLWLPSIIDGVQIMMASVTGLTPAQYRCKFDSCANDDGTYFPDGDDESLVNTIFPQNNGEPDYCRHYAFKPDSAGNCDFNDITNITVDQNVIKECTNDDQFFYDEFQMEDSYITEFNMICGRDLETPIVNSMFMVGLMAGSFIFGVLSDKLGRRNTLIPAIICSAGGSLIGAFMPEYFSFVLFRMIAGAGAEGCFLIPFVLSMEVVGIKERVPFLPWVSYSTLLANFLSVPLAGGEASVAAFGYFIKKWRTLQWVMSVICLSFALIWFIVPESPRWLISNGKYMDARLLMEKAAKRNKVKLSDHLLLPPSTDEENGEKEENESKKEEAAEVTAKDDGQYGLGDLFHPSIRKITLVLFVCWPVITLLYYGITFASEKIHLGGEDAFLGMILVSLIEIPSYLLLIVSQDVLGRKPLFVMCMLLPGVGCIIAAFLDEGILFTILVLISKLAISAAFNLTYVYTIELYPTNIRNSAVGICSTIARFGGIAAPWIGVYLPDQGSLPGWVPLFIFGMTAFIGGSLALLLPDTIGFSLPDNFEDLENIKKNSKPMWKLATTKKDESAQQS